MSLELRALVSVLRAVLAEEREAGAAEVELALQLGLAHAAG